jgi:hypothetical protein
VGVPRTKHDPATEWDAFRDTLWLCLARVFGLEDGAWPAGFPDPAEWPGGDARAVAEWLDQAAGDQGSAVMPRP